MTPDTACGCPGAHAVYAITDDHGVTQTASLCGECAAYADAEWVASGALVETVNNTQEVSSE